jgi:predicted naringenin-chalcone synthase
MSTVMHGELGVQPHVVEAVLNHVGHRAGVAGVYNRADYLKEKTEALTRWSNYLIAAVAAT